MEATLLAYDMEDYVVAVDRGFGIGLPFQKLLVSTLTMEDLAEMTCESVKG